ncbi:aminoglycoside phosphotransferase family protein [Kitasatospora kifunensis]|uniref:Aminoglycoside phosphotransferase (APT) family kinase protein n=1 Tax=Kitasatospora kifunensis TaxID=58351 RepID=A0A7W7VVE7_KITKI|nr:aminoglycoside phosphotransferase family protein [Kitasatospora kifunensis]MBB4923818.1 aminoglycoside phosphotransferase (APT) family kinase protein [Kitasatospora kifunensis]
MTAAKLHADEADTSAPLVRALLAAQFPQWAGLPVTPLDSAGTSNAIFRLGADRLVRLPRTAGSAEDVTKEHRWLPYLAPQLPVAIPAPLGQGRPGEGYPWPWSVYAWLEGEAGAFTEPDLSAVELAHFIAALHRIDPADGPPSYRSEPLAARDQGTRAAIAELAASEGETVDAEAATAVWEAGLRAPAHPGAAVWIHADLQPGNVLTLGGRLNAVIDFGCLGLGDPAVDLLAAWYLLPTAAHPAFRAALPADHADDACWARGRAWALSTALGELRYYRDTRPAMAGTARQVIRRVLTGRGRPV